MLGAEIIAFFEGIGPLGLVIAFAIISFLDGFAIPMLPEAWLMLIALTDVGIPAPIWGVVLVVCGVISAVGAQVLLYLAVKRFGMPKRVNRLMNKYTKFLIVSNEKLAFVNWLAPVIPFTGAFIAVCKWKPRLAFLYSLLGGIIKMSILVSIAILFPLLFDPAVVADASLVLVIVVLIVSLAVTYLRHRFVEKKVEELEAAEKK
jgi:hypothetical protein